MLPVVWSAKARADLRHLLDYIGDRNLPAADRLQDMIEHTADQIPLHPFMYRRGRVPGTREAVVHPNYILIYRVGDDRIDIVAVLHARQNYP